MLLSEDSLDLAAPGVIHHRKRFLLMHGIPALNFLRLYPSMHHTFFSGCRAMKCRHFLGSKFEDRMCTCSKVVAKTSHRRVSVSFMILSKRGFHMIQTFFLFGTEDRISIWDLSRQWSIREIFVWMAGMQSHEMAKGMQGKGIKW